MALNVQPRSFRTIADVLEDVKQQGLWPTTYVSGPSKGAPVHWHEYDVHAYIMEGETDFLDAEQNVRRPVAAGDKIIIEARTLHAEGPIEDKVVYLIAVPTPLAPDDFLAMKDPAEL